MLTGLCSHCGAPITFPAEAIGSISQCRFCRKDTELSLAPPPREPSIPRRLIGTSVVVVIILALGVIGVLLALKRAQNLANQRKAPAPVESPVKPANP